MKNVLGQFAAGLKELKQLAPILYRWNADSGLETDGVYAGFSAQNVQGAIPLAVGQDAKGYLSLSDRAILAAVVNAVKEIAHRIDQLSFPTAEAPDGQRHQEPNTQIA